MTSSIDFQKLWFLYKTEGSPNGISINDFCLNRAVSYLKTNKKQGSFLGNHPKTCCKACFKGGAPKLAAYVFSPEGA
jgi:hypothetical protein